MTERGTREGIDVSRLVMPERGLVIRQPHIGKILDGDKTWEMRSRRCRDGNYNL
jgi:hypothetical protein